MSTATTYSDMDVSGLFRKFRKSNDAMTISSWERDSVPQFRSRTKRRRHGEEEDSRSDDDLESLSDISCMYVNSDKSRVDSVMFQKSARMTFAIIDYHKRTTTEFPSLVDMAVHYDFIQTLKNNNHRISRLSEISNANMDDIYDGFRLSAVEAMAIICIFEDIVEQLQVISYTTNNKPWSVPDMTYKTLKERFETKSEQRVFDDIDLEGSAEPDFNIMRLNKIQCDRSYLLEVFKRTLIELRVYGMYPFLTRIVMQELLTRKEESDLFKEERMNRREVAGFEKDQAILEKTLAKEMTEKDEQLMELEEKTEQKTFYARVESNYMDRWEKSRNEQQMYKLKRQEQQLEEKLENIRVEIDVDNRVYLETQMYLNKMDKKMEDQISEWERKRNQDLEAMERQIFDLKAKKDVQSLKVEQIAREIERRENVIQNFLRLGAERKAKEEYEAFTYIMARRIQRWWSRILKQRAQKTKGKKGKGKGKGKKK